ncbi:MAG: hypothetical protein RMI91_01850 [Gemmatales bacterium]|nr:hypothetical protein [Gemmatales bacterium]MDW7993370.1 hypothetical protein [Gemmatales bacterium]
MSDTVSSVPLITPQDLEAFLDETLTEEELARIESALREQPTLRRELARILERRDQGEHSVAAIWRRFQVSCPSREELALFLAKKLPRPQADYIRFHLEVIACAICQANLDDLQSAQAQ